jgi:hypothetical protein
MSRTRVPRSKSARKLEDKIKVLAAKETAKFHAIYVKDLNRLADWLNGVSTVQVATIEHLGIKEQVDVLIRSHLDAQKAAQPVPGPAQEVQVSHETATATD